MQIGQRLVTAHVQRPNHHTLAVHGCKNLPVDMKLFLFPRLRRPVQIEKLRAQQTDAIGPITRCSDGIPHAAGIGRQLDALTVRSDGLSPHKLPQGCPQLQELLLPVFIDGAHHLTGGKYCTSPVAVHDHHFTRSGIHHTVFQSQYSGNLQRSS